MQKLWIYNHNTLEFEQLSVQSVLTLKSRSSMSIKKLTTIDDLRDSMKTYLSSLSQLIYYVNSDRQLYDVFLTQNWLSLGCHALLLGVSNEDIARTSWFGNVLNYLVKIYETYPQYLTTTDNPDFMAVHKEIESLYVNQSDVYTRSDGSKINISDMNDKHIYNALKRKVINAGYFSDADFRVLSLLSDLEAFGMLLTIIETVFDNLDNESQQLFLELDSRLTKELFGIEKELFGLNNSVNDKPNSKKNTEKYIDDVVSNFLNNIIK